MVGLQGETVRLAFIGSTDTTHSSTIGIYTADNTVRLLKTYERLIIDRLEMNGSTTVNVLAAAEGASTADQSTLLASLIPGSPSFRTPKEGVSLPKGISPSVLNIANTQVSLTGSGRIVGESQSGRPSWMAALTA